YLGDRKIEDRDLPHHSKLAQMILTEFHKVFGEIKDELKHALGRVSYTTNLWSDKNLDSYMAVTSHYMLWSAIGQLMLKTALV
ncbi:hypothetical protein EDC04DRAFT_2508709, partial [Pisolithus marmoratus]